MNDWIRCDRGLPPVRQSVQVYCPEHNNQYTASVHGDGKWYYFGFSWLEVNEEVTHWKPLGRNPIRITPEQREVLQALKVLGKAWIAKDKNGEMWAYANRPKRREDLWCAGYHNICLPGIISPLLPNWETPLKIDDALGVAE